MLFELELKAEMDNIAALYFVCSCRL